MNRLRVRLNIIGCGKLGRTLARLWHDAGQFEIGDVCNSTLASARNACNFIGAGRPLDSIAVMQAADCWMIATPDDSIVATAISLTGSGLIQSGNQCVFHCSGSQSSAALGALQSHTRLLASIHPVHSFAEPQQSLHSFAGSFCAHEGNKEALQLLLPKFSAIGAKSIAIRGEDKLLYHAASVMGCNYLVALLDASLECYQRAGIDRDTAAQLLLPLARQTLENTLQHSPAAALTGPIARGDCATVARQLQDLDGHSAELAAVYRLLGQRALEIARCGKPDGEQWREMAEILSPGAPI